MYIDIKLSPKIEYQIINALKSSNATILYDIIKKIAKQQKLRKYLKKVAKKSNYNSKIDSLIAELLEEIVLYLLEHKKQILNSDNTLHIILSIIKRKIKNIFEVYKNRIAKEKALNFNFSNIFIDQLKVSQFDIDTYIYFENSIDKLYEKNKEWFTLDNIETLKHTAKLLCKNPYDNPAIIQLFDYYLSTILKLPNLLVIQEYIIPQLLKHEHFKKYYWVGTREKKAIMKRFLQFFLLIGSNITNKSFNITETLLKQIKWILNYINEQEPTTDFNQIYKAILSNDIKKITKAKRVYKRKSLGGL